MSKQDEIRVLRHNIDVTHQRGVELSRLLRALRSLNAKRRARLAALQTRPPISVRLRRPLFGIDYAWGQPSIRSLERAGCSFVARYLSHDQGKNLHAGEARALIRAGIKIVTVWETTAERARDGYNAGAEDAWAADAQARSLGGHRVPLFFAVDFDADGPEVHAYFHGVSVALGIGRRGVYAGYRPVRYLLDRGLVDYAWQTYAWSGGLWDPRAQLHQYSNGHLVGGVDCDFDRAVDGDYGQWR